MKIERRIAVKRNRGSSLDRDQDVADYLEKRLVAAAKEAIHRLRMGEKPPTYLFKALMRFADDEDERLLRIVARNMVVRAGEKGMVISRGTKDGSLTAFESVAGKIGKSPAWVEAAYYYPTPKK